MQLDQLEETSDEYLTKALADSIKTMLEKAGVDVIKE